MGSCRRSEHGHLGDLVRASAAAASIAYLCRATVAARVSAHAPIAFINRDNLAPWLSVALRAIIADEVAAARAARTQQSCSNRDRARPAVVLKGFLLLATLATLFADDYLDHQWVINSKDCAAVLTASPMAEFGALAPHCTSMRPCPIIERHAAPFVRATLPDIHFTTCRRHDLRVFKLMSYRPVLVRWSWITSRPTCFPE